MHKIFVQIPTWKRHLIMKEPIKIQFDSDTIARCPYDRVADPGAFRGSNQESFFLS